MRRRTLAADRRGSRLRPASVGAGRAGFSLIEMIVVMAILAVVAAATAPALRLGEGEAAAIDTAARHVSALLHMARDSAVRSAEPVTVVLDPASAVFWLDVEPPASTAPTPLELPAGVRIEGRSRLRFTFRLNGSVFGDSVVVRSATGVRVVHVNPWTGDVGVR